MRNKTFRFPVTTLAGSSLKNIRSVMENRSVEPGYRLKYMLTCSLSAVLEPFNLAEKILWQNKIRKLQISKPPVFIIGFWRSGTTLLHSLLCQDPAAAYTTTFQNVFPNILLTQSWGLKKILNMVVPENRPYDNVKMDMDYPQEEDFGLMNLQPATIYKFFLFPTEFDRIIDEELFTGELSPGLVAGWKTAYREMMAKAMINTGGQRYISKNPCHLARLLLLLEMFPDAKFIFIHRHPSQVIESLYHFILSIFQGVRLQDVPPDFSRKQVVMLYNKVINRYFADRDLIPPANLIEMGMKEFVHEPLVHLEQIYRQFGLGEFREVAGRFKNYLDQNPRPEHQARKPGQETNMLLEQNALDIMKKLGYERSDLKPGSPSESSHDYSPIITSSI